MTTRSRHNSTDAAFTLVELLVVVTLMGIALGLTVFRLDSLSENGRLQSATRQAEFVLRLAMTEARTTGEPRLVVFVAGGDRIKLHAPSKNNGGWDEGRLLQTNTGAKFGRLMFEDETRRVGNAIRVNGQGRCSDHAVLLERQGKYAVLFWSAGMEAEHRIIDRRPLADDLAALRRELER